MTYSEVFNSIPWQEVASKIEQAVGIRNLNLHFEQHRDRNVRMHSINLANTCGIFQKAIAECYLTFFSNELFLPNTDPNVPDRGYKFWAQINLSYPGNGMIIGTLWVMNDNSVAIKMQDPRTGY